MNLCRLLTLLLLVAPVTGQASSDGQRPAIDPSSRPPLHSVPAAKPAPPPSARFDGGHLGPILALGLGLPDGDGAPAGQPGWDLRAGLRYATLLQILDASAWVEWGTHPAPGSDSIARTSLGLQLNLHPLFWVMVWDNMAGWLAAGAHGYVSTAAARVSLQGADLVSALGGSQASATQWAMHNEVGLGVDVPISGRGKSWGLWLTLRWGLRWLKLGEVPGPRLDLGDQRWLVALGWRSYAPLSGSPASASRLRDRFLNAGVVHGASSQSRHSSPSSGMQRNRMCR